MVAAPLANAEQLIRDLEDSRIASAAKQPLAPRLMIVAGIFCAALGLLGIIGDGDVAAVCCCAIVSGYLIAHSTANAFGSFRR